MTSSASNIDGDTDAQRKLLRRQQHDDRVAQRVPGATGKGKQVANVRNGKYLCSFSGHYATRSLDMLKYTTAAQFKQQNTAISPSEG